MGFSNLAKRTFLPLSTSALVLITNFSCQPQNLSPQHEACVDYFVQSESHRTMPDFLANTNFTDEVPKEALDFLRREYSPQYELIRKDYRQIFYKLEKACEKNK